MRTKKDALPSDQRMSQSTRRQKTHFQKQLVALMFDADITVRSLSKKIGVKEVTITLWRSGSRVPSTQNARRLSKFFKISIDDLFGPLPSGSGT